MRRVTPVPEKIFKDPKYRGKHVALIGDKVLVAGSWSKVSREFDKWLKKSKESPTLTYIPKENAMIL